MKSSKARYVNRDTGDDRTVPDIVQAAYAGRHDLVLRLLDEGQSVNSVDPVDNLSLLHIGCMQGDEKLVDIILERERSAGDVDFTACSLYRPRLAWQYAFNAHHYDLGRKVHAAGLEKERRLAKRSKPALRPI